MFRKIRNRLRKRRESRAAEAKKKADDSKKNSGGPLRRSARLQSRQSSEQTSREDAVSRQSSASVVEEDIPPQKSPVHSVNAMASISIDSESFYTCAEDGKPVSEVIVPTRGNESPSMSMASMNTRSSRAICDDTITSLSAVPPLIEEVIETRDEPSHSECSRVPPTESEEATADPVCENVDSNGQEESEGSINTQPSTDVREKARVFYKGSPVELIEETPMKFHIKLSDGSRKCVMKTSLKYETAGRGVSSTTPADTEEIPKLEKGCRVDVIGGTHKNKAGTISKVTPKMCQLLVGGNDTVYVRHHNVKIRMEDDMLPNVPSPSTENGKDSTSTEANVQQTNPVIRSPPASSSPSKSTPRSAESGTSGVTLASLKVGNNVKVVKGKYQGSIGVIRKTMKVKAEVAFKQLAEEPTMRVLRLNKTSLEVTVEDPKHILCDKKTGGRVGGTAGGRKTKRRKQDSSTDLSIFAVADADKGGKKVGPRIVLRQILGQDRSQCPSNLLQVVFGKRLVTYEIPLKTDETGIQFPTVFEDNGSQFEVVSSKVREATLQRGLFVKSKFLELICVQTSGKDLLLISVRDELEKLADFATLPPEKVASRLELLQSTAYKYKDGNKKGTSAITSFEASHIQVVEGDGIDGCGFISDSLISYIMGDNKQAERAIGLQVRIVAPKLGLFKGVLLRKSNINPDEPAITLTKSMLKVGPSKHVNALDTALLLVTQTGYHPTPLNYFIHRFLDDNETDPKKEFDKKLKEKPLDEDHMICRLWRELSVPQETIKSYGQRSVTRDGHKHAWLLGGADPTGCIPPNHIFVTGMGREFGTHKHIFITRSPAMMRESGRLIPVLSKKPSSMPEECWESLTSMPFGAVIFGSPEQGMAPLPTHISNGDLDGDLYFVCWDTDILSTVKCDPIVDVSEDSSTKEPVHDDNWFEKAQALLVDPSRQICIDQMVKKFHALSKKTADNSDAFMADADCRAFAAAYQAALDIGKHGGKVTLPEHLHDKVPQALRHLLAQE